MKNRAYLLIFILSNFCFTPSSRSGEMAEDFFVQSPKLMVQEKGQLSGGNAYQDSSFIDFSRGNISIPLPISFPEERGRILSNITPSYNSSSGISEWGLGVKHNLSITRWRSKGEIQYNDQDKLQSPFGLLVKGNDGLWYDSSLQSKLKARLVGDKIYLYLPDHTKLTFGGSNVIKNPSGVYAWYLSQAENIDGTKNEFFYEFNEGGHLYLKEIFYGGKRNYPLYKISYTYRDNLVPFIDYRSTQKTLLSKKIRKIEVFSKNLSDGTFSLSYYYTLTMLEDKYSPTYFLTRILKTYSTGKSEPATVMSYYGPELNQFDWVNVTKYDDIISAYGSNIFSPKRSTYYDLNNDGVTDVEDFNSYQTIVSGSESVKIDDLNSTTNNSCYEQSLTRRSPRNLLKVRGGHDDYKVLSVSNYTSQSDFIFCDRNGNIEYKKTLNGTWTLGKDTKTLDLNKDGLPDIIKISGNKYSVIINTSSLNSYSFEDGGDGVIRGNEYSKGNWVYDINGDGILDIVAKYDASLKIWYGKGNLKFEETAAEYTIYNKSGNAVGTISKGTMLFEDFNKDGLADIFLLYPDQSYVFLNTGDNRFEEVVLPNLSFLSQFRKKLLSNFDLLNNQSAQITAVVDDKTAYSLQLNHARTMLLKSYNDGKGNTINFNYKKSSAQEGFPKRETVLSEVSFISSGQAPTHFTLDYRAPQMSQDNAAFLGFNEVTKRDSKQEVKSSFICNENFQNLLVKTISTDKDYSTIQKVIENDYTNLNYQGITASLSEKRWEGFISTTGNIASWKEDRFVYNEDLCINNKSIKTQDGSLITSYDFFKNTILSDYSGCLIKSAQYKSAHPRHPEYDISFTRSIKRNEIGLATAIFTDDSVGQIITYDDQYRIASIETSGLGRNIFQYDDYNRLKSITMPTGNHIEISKFNNNTDLPLESIDQQDGQNDLKKVLSYDGNNRLSNFTNNLGADFQYEYRYANGDVIGFVKEIKTIENGDQSSLTKVIEYQLKTGAGNALGSIKQLDTGYVLQGIDWNEPELLKNFKYGAVAMNIDNEGLITTENIQKILKKPITESQNVIFNNILSGEKEFFTQNIARELRTELSLGNDLLLVKQIENRSDELSTLKYLNAAGKIVRYSDQSRADYLFDYDMFGQLRKITLPNGTTQVVQYSPTGKITSIARSNLPYINYTYNRLDQMVRKEMAPLDGSTPVITTYQWDQSSRITHTESYSASDATKGNSDQLSYFYDGYACDKNKPGCAPLYFGQKGFLTKIHANDFEKTFRYRADGKVLKKITNILQQKTIEEEFSYRNDGELKGRTIRLIDTKNPENNQEFALSYLFDSQGRAKSILYNGHEIITYQYDNLNKLAKVIYPLSNNSIDLQYDSLTDRNLTWNTKNEKNEITIGQQVYFNSRGLIDAEKHNFSGLSLDKSNHYDSRGFLIESTDQKGNFSFQYDNTGFLTSKNNEEFTANYPIDSFGRVNKIHGKTITYGSNGGIATIRQDGKVIAEYGQDENNKIFFKSKNGNLMETYFDWGIVDDRDGIILKIEMAGRIIGVIAKNGFNEIISDMRNSYLLQSDADLVAPYGERQKTNQLYSKINHFAHGQYDQDLDVIRMGHRFYDPSSARFLTPDPYFWENPDKCVESPVECNLYSYAGNNPITNVDPSGLSSEDPFESLAVTYFGATGIDQGWDKAMTTLNDSARGAWEGLKTFATGYAATSTAVLGGAALAPAAEAIGAQVLAKTAELIARNPEIAITAIGAGTSFVQGVAEGLVNTKSSPDIGPDFGNPAYNAISGLIGGAVGDAVRENYIER